jgi:putative peptidoglycan lipid II flippase
MIKKLFRPISTGNASALIAFASMLSYVVGLLRDRTIAVHFGTSTATDTYNASFLIPDMLFNLFIAGALVAAFMPVFSDYLIKNKEEAYKVGNTVLTGASILISILAVIAFIFMGDIVPTLFPSITPEGQANIIGMTRVLLPAALIFAISNTLGNILMTYRHFLAFAISPVLYNLGIILGVVFLNEEFGIYSASIGVLIGSILHLLIRILEITRTSYKFKPELQFRHPGIKKIVKLMIPKSISLIAWQANLYIFSIVGMRMAVGGFAAFNFARNIQSFAVSLFGISFATAVFPALNAAINRGDKADFTKNIQTTIERVLFFTVPAAVGLLLLSEPVTDLILSGGEFGEESKRLTSIILTFFALSIPFEGLIPIFAKAFYAMKNTITPMIINVISLTFVAMITIFVAPKYGIEWFSIGFTTGFVIYNILFVALLRKSLTGFKLKRFLVTFVKILIASGLMGVSIYYTLDINLGIHTALSGVIIGAVIYILTAYILKIEELKSVDILFKRIFKKYE